MTAHRSIIGLLLLLGSLAPVCAQQVIFTQNSSPSGIVNQQTVHESGTDVTTVSAPFISGRRHFVEWLVAGTRQQDVLGRAISPVSFTILENTTAQARYLDIRNDTDTDRVKDWFEELYFGTLANAPAANGDGDGFDLLAEYHRDLHPGIADDPRAGGTSQRDSRLTQINLIPVFELTVRSIPSLTIPNQDFQLPEGDAFDSPELNGQTGGLHFGFWTFNGQRQADATGRALDQVSLVVSNNVALVASFFAPGEDGDSDSVDDWFELHYIGTTNQNGNADPEGDGFSLQEEFRRDYHPGLHNDLLAGGTSQRDSGLVTINLDDRVTVEFRSDPEGIVPTQSSLVDPPSTVTSPVAPEAQADLRLTEWRSNGTRIEDALGYAINPVSLVVAGETTAIASYLSESTNADGDRLPDWFEVRYLGGLGEDENGDPDVDSFGHGAEEQRGNHPNIANTLRSGGTSQRDSGPIFLDLQPYERQTEVLVDQVSTPFYTADPQGPLLTDFGTASHPALGDWDGDEDLDLFIGSSDRPLQVFENIGQANHPIFSDRSVSFGGITPALFPAAGDWTGDGKADLGIGNATGSIQLLGSNARFDLVYAAPQSVTFAVGGGPIVPAFAHMNPDAFADLLVLLDDGTVSLFLNSGNIAAPYMQAGRQDDFLGVPVPDARGLSVADVNRDGLLDVLVSDAIGRIWDFRQLAGGGFQLKSRIFGGSGSGFANGLTATLGDLDLDGDQDVLGGFDEGGLTFLLDPRLGVPRDLLVGAGLNSIRLSWLPNRSSRLKGYHLYRRIDPIDFARINANPIRTPRFVDSGVSPGSTYDYRITVFSTYNAPGFSDPQTIESDPSNPVTATAGQVLLEVHDKEVEAGEQLRLQIRIPQSDGLTSAGMMLRIDYDPALLTPVDALTSVLTRLTSLSHDAVTANGQWTIQASSGVTLTGSGVLLELLFDVDPGALQGTQSPVSIGSASMNQGNGNPASVFSTPGTVSITASPMLEGDLDGNGFVNVVDLDRLLELLTSFEVPTPEELEAGDLNGNGRLDVSDANLLFRRL